MTTPAVPADWRYQPERHDQEGSPKTLPQSSIASYSPPFAESRQKGGKLAISAFARDLTDLGTASRHSYKVFLRLEGVTSTQGRSFVSVGFPRDVETENVYTRLLEIARLRSGWDGRGAPEPSATAVIRALDVVAALEENPAASFDRVIPDANGGVGFVFLGRRSTAGRLDRYASIDCSNSGRTMLVLVDRAKRSHVVREIETARQALSDALVEIDTFLTT